MKNTLMMAALCLGLGAAAYAEGSYTLGETTYTTQTGLTGWNGGSYNSFTFTLSPDLFSVTDNTAATSNALTTASDGSQTYASDKVALNSIGLVLRNGNTTSDATTLIIKLGNEVVATSTSASTAGNPNRDVFNSNTLYTRPMQTFTFDSARLTVGETYTAAFLNTDGEAQNVSLAASYNGNNTANEREGGTLAAAFGSSLYQPAGMVISTTALIPADGGAGSIPEPTTATLSLFALAGLAARRRRK